MAYDEGGGELIQLAASQDADDQALYRDLVTWILRREALADTQP